MQNNYDLRKDLYMEQINDIKKKQKIIVYNLNPSKYFDIEWDNLKSQVKEYTKLHQINGWEISNELIDNVSNPHKNTLLSSTKGIEPYDVSYEKFAQQKNC